MIPARYLGFSNEPTPEKFILKALLVHHSSVILAMNWICHLPAIKLDLNCIFMSFTTLSCTQYLHPSVTNVYTPPNNPSILPTRPDTYSPPKYQCQFHTSLGRPSSHNDECRHPNQPHNRARNLSLPTPPHWPQHLQSGPHAHLPNFAMIKPNGLPTSQHLCHYSPHLLSIILNPTKVRKKTSSILRPGPLTAQNHPNQWMLPSLLKVCKQQQVN